MSAKRPRGENRHIVVFERERMMDVVIMVSRDRLILHPFPEGEPSKKRKKMTDNHHDIIICGFSSRKERKRDLSRPNIRIIILPLII